MTPDRYQPDLHSLGEFIRRQRHHLGLTQAELAERLMWEQKRVSTLETGRYGLPSLPLLARLADALHVRLSDVLAAVGYGEGTSPAVRETETISSNCAALLYCLEQILGLPLTDLSRTFSRAMAAAAASMGAEAVLLYLHDDPAASLHLTAASGEEWLTRMRTTGLAQIPIAGGDRLAQVFRETHAFLTGHAQEDVDIPPALRRDLGVQSLLAAPVRASGMAGGVLVALSSDRERFDATDRSFFAAVAHWVALIVRRSRLDDRQKQ